MFLKSITPSGWRIAHNRLSRDICANHPHGFHYVNEIPLTLVEGKNNTFFLISLQTHFYNTITGQKQMHVTQWKWDDLNAISCINDVFDVCPDVKNVVRAEINIVSSRSAIGTNSVRRKHTAEKAPQIKL